MNTKSTLEYVWRVHCQGCGCTGPPGSACWSAEFLAVKCGWTRKSLCPHCHKLNLNHELPKKKK